MYRDLELCTRCGELRGAVGVDRRAGRGAGSSRSARASGPCGPRHLPRGGASTSTSWPSCAACAAPRWCRAGPASRRRCATRAGPAACPSPGRDRLEEWSREALFRNLVDAGLSHRSIVPLADYLEVVQHVDRGRRVDECLDFLGRRPDPSPRPSTHRASTSDVGQDPRRGRSCSRAGRRGARRAGRGGRRRSRARTRPARTRSCGAGRRGGRARSRAAP